MDTFEYGVEFEDDIDLAMVNGLFSAGLSNKLDLGTAVGEFSIGNLGDLGGERSSAAFATTSSSSSLLGS